MTEETNKIKRFGRDLRTGELYPESKGPFVRYREHAEVVKQKDAEIAALRDELEILKRQKE